MSTIYTVSCHNYSHGDYNEPYIVRDFNSKTEAIEFASNAWAHLCSYSRGRVDVSPVNPVTGLHDLLAVWQRDSQR